MVRIPRRRILFTGAALLAMPLASIAQQSARIWRIGILSNGTVASGQNIRNAFVLGLGEHGYVDGRSFVIESRWAEGRLERLPTLVAELLAQRIDILFAPSGVAAQAAKESGTTIPIPSAGW